MKTEEEIIKDLKISACFACKMATFDPYQIICTCSIKGPVEVMSCCGQFEQRLKREGE